MVSASLRKGRVGLHVHLPGAAESVEVVNIIAAQERLERVEHVGERHPRRADLGAVNIRVELRRAGPEAIEQADQAGLPVALRGQAVRPCLMGAS